MITYIVDSFTKEPFKGNPAGVCFVTAELSDEKMLQIARELGLSETAFIRETNKAGIYLVRYFSPKKEIPLCGHATLASAKIIFNKTPETEIHFLTFQGLDLPVKKKGEEIIMEFPIYGVTDSTAPPAMLNALGLDEVVRVSYSEKNKIMLLEVTDAALLANLKPDFNALLHSCDNINGVLVTAPSDTNEYDFHYRYFWPWAGTNEDPVTGGVQTFLAKYWGEKFNKIKMKAFQSSGRTGYMDLELKAETVLVVGHAVIIFEGNLFI